MSRHEPDAMRSFRRGDSGVFQETPTAGPIVYAYLPSPLLVAPPIVQLRARLCLVGKVTVVLYLRENDFVTVADEAHIASLLTSSGEVALERVRQ